MRIRIVTETKRQSWVLRPLAESLAAEIDSCDVGTESLPWADWNVFFNYALYSFVDTHTAALFTHKELVGPLVTKWYNTAAEVDWCFCQAYNTLKLLPEGKASVLPTYPTRPEYYRDVVIGVCGRDYKSGRKRLHWLKEVEEIEGLEVRLTGGKLNEDQMLEFYNSIDYLLVTSSNEGGPQPVLEAISLGVPTITPDVGYCWEYPGLRYRSKQELLSLLYGLTIPRDGWKRSAQIFLDTLRL